MTLLVVAILVFFAGGTAAFAAGRSARASTWLGAGSAVVGCALGLVPVLRTLSGGGSLVREVVWTTPAITVALGLDALSAFFLVPVFVLGALAAVHAVGSMKPHGLRRSLGNSWFAFNALLGGMTVVAAARDAVLFLVAWEIMSLAAWMLVAFDHEREEVRTAGWVYLVAAHLGTAALVALFLILIHHGGQSLEAVSLSGSGSLRTVLFVLALLGFGVKAGFVPLHVWAPRTYAAAPSHVSALMSGAMSKLGLYGILRVAILLGAPQAWWGPALVVIGLTGALTGVSLGLGQRDLKRTLACSSIENLGLITFGLGLGFLGWTTHRPELAALGFAAGFLHIWNHAAMKGLMFFGAGSVVHGAGTQDMELLGGLLKRMPVTGALMLCGAAAMSGLPPLNGFVSEWMLYIGVMRTGLSGGVLPLLGVGALSLVGGLAAACFLRLAGIVLLGSGRSEAARAANESPRSILLPCVLLAAACVALAVLPGPALTAAGRAIATVGVPPPPPAPVSATTLAAANAVLLGALLAGAALLALVLRGRPVFLQGTWGCGYLAPTTRLQYTARSFSEFLTARVLPKFFRPPSTVRRPEGFFPSKGDFRSDTSDPFSKGVYEPFFTRWADRFSRLRWLQQGQLNIYIIYILVVVVLGLGWATWRTLRAG